MAMRRPFLFLGGILDFWAAPGKAILAVLIIAIACSSLVVLAALHLGIRSRVEAIQTVSLRPGAGSVIYVMPRLPIEKEVPRAQRLEDLEACRSRFASSISFAGAAWARTSVVNGAVATPCTLMACQPEYMQIRGYHLIAGRGLSYEDERSLSRSCVISRETARSLFGLGDPIGKSVAIDGVPMQVVGVRENLPLLLGPGGDSNDDILVPLATGLKRFLGMDGPSVIRFRVLNPQDEDVAVSRLERFLTERHPEQVKILSSSRLVAQFLANKRGMLNAALLIAVAAALAGLTVCGSLITLSLLQRIGDLAIRRALGATLLRLRIEQSLHFSVLSFLGSAVGAGGGSMVAAVLPRLYAIPGEGGFSKMPVSINAVSVVVPSAIYCLALTVLTTILSWYFVCAKRLTVIERK
jgi:putative ABC transport system permease protein